MNRLPVPVPDLGARQGVAIHEQKIIMPAGVDVMDNGLSQGDSTWHLRVIDVAHGVAWLVPFNNRAGRTLAKQINDVIGGIHNAEN